MNVHVLLVAFVHFGLVAELTANCIRLLMFLILYLCFLTTVASYDPIADVADIHRKLSERLNVGSLGDVSGVGGVQDYLEEFTVIAAKFRSFTNHKARRTQHHSLATDNLNRRLTPTYMPRLAYAPCD